MTRFFQNLLLILAFTMELAYAKLETPKEMLIAEGANCSYPDVSDIVTVHDMGDDTIQRVYLTCPDLYDSDGGSVITCVYNNDTETMEWTPEPADFTCNYPCTVPDLPEGLVVTPPDQTIRSGHDIYFNCTEGILPDDAPTKSRCYNASWTHPIPECNLKHGHIRMGNGRVLVTYGETEGSICYTPEWDIYNANVVCRQLGLRPYALSVTRIPFGSTNDLIHFSSVRCQGYEERLIDCELSFSPCSSRYYVGVTCLEGDETANEGAVRLMEATGAIDEPRVEMYLDGSWGGVCAGVCSTASTKETLCSEMLVLDEAGWFCQELGYPGASMAMVRTIDIGDDEEDPVIDLTCPGDAESLEECSHRYLPTDVPCSFGAVHVACDNPDPFALRLINGSSKDEGRLEIFDGDHWRTVPPFNDSLTSELICEHLTGNSGQTQLADGVFGSGLVMPKYTYSCPENADTLSNCNVVLVSDDVMDSGPISLYCHRESVQTDQVELWNPKLICLTSFACSALIVVVAMVVRCKYHQKRVIYRRMESYKFQYSANEEEGRSPMNDGNDDDAADIEESQMRTDSFKDAVFEDEE